MTKDAIEQVWNCYLEAYGNVAPEKRERLLRESVSDDVISTNPGEDIQGFANLLAHVDLFQQRLPGACFKINKLLSTMSRFWRNGLSTRLIRHR